MSLERLIGRRLPLVVAAALAVGLAALACSGEDIEQVDEADMARLEAARAAEFGSMRQGQDLGGHQIGDFVASIKNSTHPDVTVPVGTVVKWQNDDGVAHTTTAGTPGEPSDLWASGSIKPGSDFTFRFKEAGEYKYFCSIHNFMTATITVTE